MNLAQQQQALAQIQAEQAAWNAQGPLHTAMNNGRPLNEIQALILNHPEWSATQLSLSMLMSRAIDKGKADLVRWLLTTFPQLDVNYRRHPGGYLQEAVNRKNYGALEVLLQDPRIDVTIRRNDGEPPLWSAYFQSNADMFRTWVASGKPLQLGGPEDPAHDIMALLDDKKNTRHNNTLHKFLKKYLKNPREAVLEARTKLVLELERLRAQGKEAYRWPMLDVYRGGVGAEVYAQTVFLSDGLLKIKDDMVQDPRARFFAIMLRLPMELQMLTANKVGGSEETAIKEVHAEGAFRRLARYLLGTAT